MTFFIQFLVIGLCLYFVPWFGNFGEEFKLALVAGAALLGALFSTFLLDLVAAPSRIDKSQVHEIRSLRNAIRSSQYTDRASRALSKFWETGRSLSDSREQKNWHSSVSEYLRDNFDAQAQHKWAAATSKNHAACVEVVNELAGMCYMHLKGAHMGNSLISETQKWKMQGEKYTEHTETWNDAKPEISPPEG